MLTFLRSLPSEYIPARPQVIGNSTVDSLRAYHFLQSVFPKESKNPVGNECHEQSAVAFNRDSLQRLGGGQRGDCFGNDKGDFGRGGRFCVALEILAEEDCFGGGRGILIAEAVLVTDEKILIVEEMEQRIGNKI